MDNVTVGMRVTQYNGMYSGVVDAVYTEQRTARIVIGNCFVWDNWANLRLDDDEPNDDPTPQLPQTQGT